MRKKEIEQIKSMALNYEDPIRGKILALVAYVERLQRDNRKLDCLEMAGVDNWSGYEYAMELFYEGDED